MAVDGVITHFESNLENTDNPDSALEIHVWVQAQDEASRAGMECRVRKALEPLMAQVIVKVYSERRVVARG